jgi:ubiquinone/menaquinone biosynthesis C-methylase UbiE
MAVAEANIYAAPFDAIAELYDETFTASKIGRAQRASVWNKLGQVFRSGDRVVEIGCGTGVDACFLAQRGVNVIACDSSPQMIAVATRRIAEKERLGSVSPRLLAAEDIHTLRNDGSFDGAFSNFGALNCVQDLRSLARDLAALLNPGATALLCWMGPCCLWELAWYLAKGKPRKAFRRFHREGVTTRVGEANIRVRYPSVRELARTFAPEFQLKSIKGIGVAVPPSYLESWVKRLPGLFDLTVRADSLLSYCPGIRVLADHVLLEFQREDVSGE